MDVQTIDLNLILVSSDDGALQCLMANGVTVPAIFIRAISMLIDLVSSISIPEKRLNT